MEFKKHLTHRGRHLHIRIGGDPHILELAQDVAVRHILKYKAAPPPGVRTIESYHPATQDEARELAWHEAGHAYNDGLGGWMHFRIENEGPHNEAIVYPSYEPDNIAQRTNTHNMQIAIGRGRTHMSKQDKSLFHIHWTRRKFFHKE